MKNVFRWLLLVLSVVGAGPVARALTVEDALNMAARNNPSLQAVRTEAKRASEQLNAEESRFPWLLSLRAAPGITQTPSLNSLGATNSSYAEGIDLSGALTKPFSQGTELVFEVGASADRRRAPVLPTAQEPLLLGPGYGLMARIGLRHPFLRGGRDSTEAALRSAQIRKHGVDASLARQASELSRDVLVAYWELWYAQQALEIDEAALALAHRTLAEAQGRIAEGALAPVDGYSFEIRVATLEESLAASRVERDRRETELRRLLGVDDQRLAASEPPRDFDLPENLNQLALEASSQRMELEADVTLAENSLILARDATRARLNVEASVSSRGLGNKELWPAVDGVFGSDGLSASVNVIYEAPLNRGAVQADESAARLSVESAQWRLKSFEQQLAAEIRTQSDRQATARNRVALASRTLEIAEKLADAESQRLEFGASIPLQVLEAESNLRDSRLRVARARVDLSASLLSLLHLSGQLLTELPPVD